MKLAALAAYIESRDQLKEIAHHKPISRKVYSVKKSCCVELLLAGEPANVKVGLHREICILWRKNDDGSKTPVRIEIGGVSYTFKWSAQKVIKWLRVVSGGEV